MEKASSYPAGDLLSDVKFGIRSLSRSPVFSLFAILTLALGIGATTTVFTLVNTVLLHPLAANDPSHLVAIYAARSPSAWLLGASMAAILLHILRQGMFLVFIGIGIGLGLSLLIRRLFSKMLFGLSPADPLSLIGASFALIAVAALACYLPAFTASRYDPMRALRQG